MQFFSRPPALGVPDGIPVRFAAPLGKLEIAAGGDDDAADPVRHEGADLQQLGPRVAPGVADLDGQSLLTGDPEHAVDEYGRELTAHMRLEVSA